MQGLLVQLRHLLSTARTSEEGSEQLGVADVGVHRLRQCSYPLRKHTGYKRADQQQQQQQHHRTLESRLPLSLNQRTSDRDIVQGAYRPAVWVRIQPSVLLICGQRVLDLQVGAGS